MAWFTASAIFAFIKNHRARTGSIAVHENVDLLEAADHDAARISAEQLARSCVMNDPSITVDGEPASYEFIGIRKTVEVVSPNQPEADFPVLSAPLEVTYSEFEIESESALRSFVRGEPTAVMYVE